VSHVFTSRLPWISATVSPRTRPARPWATTTAVPPSWPPELPERTVLRGPPLRPRGAWC
jgi:hypothetical protein